MKKLVPALVGAVLLGAVPVNAATYTNVFFNNSQTAAVVSSNINAVTIQSGDYRFTYSVDGYWSSGGGPPTGRFFSVFWPTGVQAQAITAGPLLGNGANITIKRADGKPFDLSAFTGKLLANTAGAGGAFEITPQLNGNDASNAPVMYDATGYGGQSFSYTPQFHNYDTYKIHLWVDWALMALTLIDTNPPLPPTTSFTIAASVLPVDAGVISGGGIYVSNTTCTLTATPNPGWGLQNWTQNGVPVSTALNYSFTVRSNRTLVANFVPAYNVKVEASPAIGGSVTGGGTYASNAPVTVRATPANGFQFVNWTDYGTPVSTATNYSFNATADHGLIANFAPQPQTVVFDFDTGTPLLSQSQGLPGSQSSSGLTAFFTTLAGGWSMQSQQSSIVGAPPSFAGLFLYPSTWGSTLEIQFSEPVTDLGFDFMTGELAADYDIAGTMRVTAYTNSIATPTVGSGTAQGAWLHGSYPDGHLAFHSATPFTIVKVDMAPVGTPSGLFFLDNLVAQRAAVTTYTIAATAAPTNAGFISGAGTFADGSTASLSATENPGFVFANWTENGTVVETLPTYSFSVSSNRTLMANFTTNLPPLAFGGTFFQLAGQPLAISIVDLMAFDYDPDGDPIWLTSVSPTNSIGLPLTNTATEILVPASAVASSFTYSISDGHSGDATGTVTVSIITNVTSQALSLDLVSAPGAATVKFSGVPWYYYTAERATNVTFTGAVRTWSVRAGADGSIQVGDDFTDLGGNPTHSFYRLRYTP